MLKGKSSCDRRKDKGYRERLGEKMDVLEKILEEIDRLDEPYYKGYICKYDVQDIIRNHS